ncbi:GntR family transcriptional regulator [Streptomyces radiopugnans]|uniref:GntR family transcriptional regulator n=1 Tax=Streptomyces radiopugnans TaxID=403935 RepID=A0A1H8Z2K5_9ACTN|nr:GntR family transcriptional regulator [Streptomyces radiopugnans]SEP58497.1 GntR family transcriptional regulator [Streptomyces radiopugnans]
MAPRVQRAAPPYVQITDHFRQQILDGVLTEGEKLPSVAQISKDWSVATATAAKALSQLRTEGYVRSSSQGTFVSIRQKQTTGPDRLQMMRATGSGFRPGERVEILDALLVTATDEVAEALGVEAGSQVVQRRRVYLDDEGVVTLSTSWLSRELADAAPELLSTEPLPKMTFGLIEDRTGRRTVRRRDVVAIRPVTEEAAPVLGLEAGTPALTMTNRYWDQNGEVTEYALDFLGAGRELSAEYALD